MKITHVIESSATGTLAVVLMLANNQVNDGHQVSVIYSVRPDTPEELPSMFDKRIYIQKCDMSIKKAVFSIAELRRIITIINPDIIHLHSSVAGFVGRLACLFLSNVKIFYSPHCISFMRKDISLTKKKLFIALEKLAGCKHAAYIACSQSEFDAIKKCIPGSQVFIVNNAYDGNIHHVVESTAIEKNRKTIVTVGGIRRQKDPMLFSEIAKRYKSSNYDFVWIGDGDEKYKRELSASSVNITGWMGKDELLKFIRNSDLYLSCSTWEGMPISILEAMANGLPVVASNCTGNKDIINHKKNGYLFDSIDEACMFIDEVFNDNSRSRELINNSLDDIQKLFSVNVFLKNIYSIYDK
ncbi:MULTISPECIES: glycosyltransferase [Enterobacteriaceae]|uniref:glycosyltransferase n=1 Tax=Gammaproteobacteria TaxID=1236 RepID=UPI001F2094A6|nr:MULTISPECIES: glycosyltransferase [Enterobacteriaceae]EKU8635367.1 glycosyltransferase [Raoultella ornithinolytica]HDU4479283.1 glycosyltransferase [Klebsiella pneumoniae subsp. ozaenae]MCM6296129.1 glycosyltransferase [Klebsiella pneumoniae]WGG65742.1 glycosyltransferase [Enterobacter ludwigii]HBR5493598.1 glycosyltransferase [Klebsiella pneumoniae]